MVEREGDPRREEKELLVIERELSLRVEHAMVEEKRREEQRECTMYNVVEFVMLMLLSMNDVIYQKTNKVLFGFSFSVTPSLTLCVR